jgi:hypothetical protein
MYQSGWRAIVCDAATSFAPERPLESACGLTLRQRSCHADTIRADPIVRLGIGHLT